MAKPRAPRSARGWLRFRGAKSAGLLAALAMLSCGEPLAPSFVAPPAEVASVRGSALIPGGTALPTGPSTASPTAAASAERPTRATPDAPAPTSAPIEPVRAEIRLGGAKAVRSGAGLVASVEPHATRAAVAVLEQGGNAVDAAITAAYVLAVTHPSAGNLGGGGFLVGRMADGRSFALDFRDAAPATTTVPKLVAEVKAGGVGWPSVAVPGTVAGLEQAREKWGSLPRKKLLARAIELAERGVELSPAAARRLGAQWKTLALDAEARSIFGQKGGKSPRKAGDRLIQRDLARTLSSIATRGAAGFYSGPFAKALAKACAKKGCDVTERDLRDYRAKPRETLQFVYRGLLVETMPPPSMGGVAMAEILLGLEQRPESALPIDDPRAVHAFVELAKQAYAARRTLGFDTDFDPSGADLLARRLAPESVAARARSIDPTKPRRVADLLAADVAEESPETTHVSVVDAQGNAASLTVTLSASFGAKVVVPGTGVLMSNTLGAFTASGPNTPAPGKHAASSMSPTVVSRDGKTVLVIGSPGGDTIPNTMAQVLRNLASHGMTIDEAIVRGRVHHQLEPDAIRTEISRDLPKSTKEALGKLGHRVVPSPIALGDVKAIVLAPDGSEAWGFADPREGGLALGVTRRAK